MEDEINHEGGNICESRSAPGPVVSTNASAGTGTTIVARMYIQTMRNKTVSLNRMLFTHDLSVSTRRLAMFMICRNAIIDEN